MFNSANSYEAYEAKIERIYFFKRLVYKNRLLLIILASVVALLSIAFFSTKGMILDVVHSEKLSYGEQVDIKANGLFSNIFYEYSAQGKDEWTKEVPYAPGDYQIKISSKGSFGRINNKIVSFSIEKKYVDLSIENLTVEFGEEPKLNVDLASGDRVSFFTFNYEDLSKQSTKVNLNSIQILNGKNEDVTGFYNFTFDEKTINFTTRKVQIALVDYVDTYNGLFHESNQYTLSAGSISEGHRVEIVTNGSLKEIGTIENIIEEVSIFDGDLNVSSNYEITYLPAMLTVLPQTLNIESKTSTKVYDGTPLYSVEYEITNGNIANGHRLNVDINTQIIDVGTTDNEFTYWIADESNNDVTNNYNVRKDLGFLEVTRRELTLRSESQSKIYDGLSLSNNAVATVQGTLVEGQELLTYVSGEITNYGTVENTYTYKILDINDTDVTSNYNVTQEFGTLEIIGLEIILKSESDSKTYDGLPLTKKVVNITQGSLLDGEELFVNVSGVITNSGTVENTYTYSIINPLGEDVTRNYRVTKEYGTLEITRREITIESESDIKEYDGQALTKQSVLLIEGSFVNAEELQSYVTGTITNVGTVLNEYTFTIINLQGDDVTSNYNVNNISGTLEVTERDVTFESVSDIKIYDGLALASDSVFVMQGSLATTDSLVPHVTGTITNVGTASNEYTFTIVNLQGDDVTSNYNVTQEFGTLEVSHRAITIESASETKKYDGLALTNDLIFVTAGSIPGIHNLHTDVSGAITNVGWVFNDYTYFITDEFGVDVTENYTVIQDLGILTVELGEMIISSASDEKIYDGTPLANGNYEITGTISDMISIVVYLSESISDVGTISNNFTYEIRNQFGEDVEAYYEVVKVIGLLEVLSRVITIESDSESKVYDGTPLTNSLVFVTQGSLAENQELLTYVSGTILNCGTTVNEYTYKIVNINGDDVTSNYTVTQEYGALEVTRREITIESESDTKVYDGLALTNESVFITSGSIAENQNLLTDVSGIISEYGVVLNTYTYKIVDVNGDDVTHNYDVIQTYGTLEITQRVITIESESESKVYDGTPLTNGAVFVTSGSLALGQDLLTDVSGTITNVGTVSNYYTYRIINLNGDDVTHNYDVTQGLGTLEVTPRVITIESGSAIKIYDGLALTNNLVQVIKGSLALTDYLNPVVMGTITNVGSVVNEYTYTIINLNAEDVTRNYDVTQEFGTLEVTRCTITIESVSDSKVYDGLPFISDEILVTNGSLAVTDYISPTMTNPIINVGIGMNEFIYTIINLDGDDVTNCYIVTQGYGTLEITHRDITIESVSDSKVYDGLPFISDEILVTNGSLAITDHISPTMTNPIINVGIGMNEFTYTIINLDGDDVTSNYIVTQSYGILEITHRTITIESASETKKYDGLALTNDLVFVTASSIPNIHNLITDVSGTITNVGWVFNDYTYFITDEFGVDVTENYIVTQDLGVLTVELGEMIISSASDEKIYDGTPLANGNYEITGTISDMISVVVYLSESITDVGAVSNDFTYTIRNQHGDDVEAYYEIVKIIGLLEVLPIEITIKTEGATKIYDGAPLTMPGYTQTNGQLLLGHYIDVNVVGSITDVGVVKNDITYRILDQDNTDVTHNYLVIEDIGDLEVTRRAITITTGSATKEYDGAPLTNDSTFITDGSLVFAQELLINVIGTITNYGTVLNDFTYTIVNLNADDVTHNYEVTKDCGTLEITRRTITIESVSDSKVYDGLPFISDEILFTNGSLAITDHISPTMTNPIINVGIAANEFTYTIINLDGDDVTNCYIVTQGYGTLEITHRDITIESVSDSKVYDGLPFISDEILVTNGSLAVTDHISPTMTNPIINVGIGMNEFTYTIINLDGDDVTNCYIVTQSYGTLEITHREVTIESASETKKYDGLALTNDLVFVTASSIPNIHNLIADVSGAITNVGWVFNDYTYFITDEFGVDVTENYIVTQDLGVLTVELGEMIISSASDEKIYDGAPLANGNYEITGTISDMISIVVYLSESITDVGAVSNDFTYTIRNQHGDDVEAYYEITKIIGLLEVLPIEITIKTEGATKIYDGAPLTMPGYTQTNGQLLLGHYIDVNVVGSITDVGVVKNDITYRILDQDNTDVTHNYLVIEDIGDLEVTRRAITITTGSATKEYDGAPLINEVVLVTKGSLVVGQELLVNVIGTITNYGTVLNDFTYTIVNLNADDVTHNYEVTKECGTLEITRRTITIESVSDSKVYDGLPFISDEILVTNGSLAITDHISPTMTNPIINVGIGINEFIYTIINLDGDDVTSNYIVTQSYGTLEITHREVTIESASETKKYDGLALTNDLVFVTAGSVPNIHNLITDVSGAITNVGWTFNEYTYFITDEFGVDVTENYIVTQDLGVLTVELGEMIISSASDEKIYDGTPLANGNYEITGTISDMISVVVYLSESITDVGTVSNDFTYTIRNQHGDDVEAYYEIVKVIGLLEVLPIEITIKTEGATKIYDGAPLTMPGYTQTKGQLLLGHYIDVNVVGSITDVGVVKNDITYRILDQDNTDVTHNYLVIEDIGDLEVTRRAITITSNSATKEYDGAPLINEVVLVTEGSLAITDHINHDVMGTITNAGSVVNDFTYTIINLDGDDVTHNYDVTKECGTLEVTRRTITIESVSDSKVYDGLPFISDEILLTNGSLAITDHISPTMTNPIINVGTAANEFTYTIINLDGDDVTSNYIVTQSYGTLEITHRDITIESGSSSKEYDGLPLTKKSVLVIEGSLANSDVLMTYVTGTITGCGVVQNTYTYTIINPLGEEVTQNYTVTKEHGTLEVTLREITIQSESDTKEYDGLPLTKNSVLVIEGSLADGDVLMTYVTGTITESGIVDNIYTFEILDINGNNVTYNYDVTQKYGQLEVSLKRITITSGSASKKYDGLPLYKNEFSYTGELDGGHRLEVQVTGEITEVGETDNTLVYEIFDVNDTLVTDMYTVTLQYGLLKVIAEDNENGSNQAEGYVLSDFGDPGELGLAQLFKLYSEVSELVYLRDKSYGDYNMNHWGNPNMYINSEGEFNSLQMPGLYLDLLGLASTALTLEAIADNLSYYLPYYSTSGFYESNNDVYVQHKYILDYLVDYIHFNYNDYNDETLIGTIYEQDELNYRQFVYQNYLTLPSTTLAGMLQLAQNNGLDPNSANIIKDVQNYILNSANYNLDYGQFPEGSDMALYFLEELREGICQHFATSATAMYRALGIPARYVTGFAAYTESDAWVVVDEKMAHAWVEVYIDGFGWMPIEVTPGDVSGGPGYFEVIGNQSYGENPDELTEIYITSENGAKKYDGLPFSKNNVIISGKLKPGHSVDYYINNEITNVGSIDNVFTSRIVDSQGTDVSAQYFIRNRYGLLVIVPNDDRILLEIQLFDKKAFYNGENVKLDNTDYWIPSRNLPLGYTVELEIEGNLIGSGGVFASVKSSSIKIFNQEGHNVTNRFKVVTYSGMLEVVKRELVLRSMSAEKYYNGIELTYQVYNLEKGKLVLGHQIEVVMPSSITEVGEIANEISSVIILDSEGRDVTRNYKIVIKNTGLLKVLESLQ